MQHDLHCICCSRVTAWTFGDRTSPLHQAHGPVFTICEVADAEPSTLASGARSGLMRNPTQVWRKYLFQRVNVSKGYNVLFYNVIRC